MRLGDQAACVVLHAVDNELLYSKQLYCTFSLVCSGPITGIQFIKQKMLVSLNKKLRPTYKHKTKCKD